MLEFMGIVDDNYDNFADLIAIKTAARLLPLFIIPILIPDLTPDDPLEPSANLGAAKATPDMHPNKDAESLPTMLGSPCNVVSTASADVHWKPENKMVSESETCSTVSSDLRRASTAGSGSELPIKTRSSVSGMSGSQ